MDFSNLADHNGTPRNRDHIAAPHGIGDLEIDLLTDLSAASRDEAKSTPPPETGAAAAVPLLLATAEASCALMVARSMFPRCRSRTWIARPI